MIWVDNNIDNVWLPYTQMQWGTKQLAVKTTDKCTIELEDGTKLIDGTSSWWAACHGYNHPHIVKAMQTQAAQLSHVMFAGLANKPAYELATRLCKLTKQDRCFFSDSGSTAVEVALKMAVQYWHNKGNTAKNKIICFKNGYHGDTMGAMSVSSAMHSDGPFSHHVPKQFIVSLPRDELEFAEFKDTLAAISKQTAALILEPLMQGAGGMRFHSSDVVAEIYKLCKQHDILFITDEVATGFGRTGYMFACDEVGITPDIICLGKALTAGMCTSAATLAGKHIFEAFYDKDLYKCFMHGPTYMGNPLACAAANSSLDIFAQQNVLNQVANIEQQLHTELKKFRKLDSVKTIRVRGAVGVIELYSGNLFFELRTKLVEQGVWLRPFGNVVYITPPFIITVSELQQVIDACYKVLDGV